MAIRTQVRLVQLTGSLDDGGSLVGPTIPFAADSLQGSLDEVADAIRRITGAGSFQNAVQGEFSQAILPNTPGGQDLGSTAKEWNDLFLGDTGVISLGSDQDVTLTHVADTGVLLNSTRKIQFGDAASFVQQSGDGILRIDGEATIDLNASTAVLVSNDLKLDSDSAVLGFGADNDVTLTHVADTALELNNGIALRFGAATEQISEPSAGEMEVLAGTQVTLKVGANDELAVAAAQSTFGGNIHIPDDGYIGAASAQTALQIEDDGDLKIVKDLIFGTNATSVVNSAGVDVITFNQTEVLIPGDLTVKGTTTSIDTTNLEVEDKFIGLNYTSGSISGGAGDVGIIIAQARGDTPTNQAMFYDSSETEFAFVSTVSPASGSSITVAAYADLHVKDLKLEGLDVFGDGTGRAITLTTGNAPDVGVINNMTIEDDKLLSFGAAGDGALIQHNAGASKLIVSASVGTGVVYGAGVGQTHTLQLADVTELNVTAGEVQVKSKLASASGNLIVSGASGAELQLKAGTTMMLGDGFSEGGGWSDTDGIKLADGASSWLDFEAAYGEVALLDAIVSAGGGAGTLQKRSLEVTGSGYPTGYTVPVALNLSNISASGSVERVDMYVNGQLMASSSEVSGNGDYALIGIGAGTNASFQFDLILDDVIQAVVR